MKDCSTLHHLLIQLLEVQNLLQTTINVEVSAQQLLLITYMPIQILVVQL